MPDISLIPKGYTEERRNWKTIFSKIGVLIFALLIISLLIYGGLHFYNQRLNKQLVEFQGQIGELNKQRDKDFEVKVQFLDKALKNLQIVLRGHLYWSNLFSRFETLTVPQVYFSDFSAALADSGSLSLVLSGKTAGYTYLAKQMVSFSQEKTVSNINVSAISLSTDGSIEFKLNIDFFKDILLKQ